MKSTFLAVLLATGAALAVPATPAKRRDTKGEDGTTVGQSDVSILTYALILEHLEDNFYRGGLANFTQAQFMSAGFGAAFYSNLQDVSADETTHVTFLTAALTAVGATPVAECVYDFPYTDPTSFVKLASVLEGVGVSAYLGAAADIANPDYETVAGSILTVEARHNSYLRAQLSEVPFPAPFDTPLDFDQVYSLASQFIVSCPGANPLAALGVKAFPTLSVNATSPINVGSTITLETSNYVLTDPNGNTGGALYGAFFTITGPLFVPATPVTGGYSVVVPAGVAGQTYVVLTACNETVTDSTTAAGPAIVEVSPLLTTAMG